METSVLAIQFATLASKKLVKTLREGQFLSDDCLKIPGKSHFSTVKKKPHIFSPIHKVTFL